MVVGFADELVHKTPMLVVGRKKPGMHACDGIKFRDDLPKPPSWVVCAASMIVFSAR